MTALLRARTVRGSSPLFTLTTAIKCLLRCIPAIEVEHLMRAQ
jgi:hypothetical protein